MEGVWRFLGVIKGVDRDRDKWITVSTIAAPLKSCTAMAAEVVGASVLPGILDLVLGKISVENIKQCIGEIIKYT